jgi:hypothetical protein
MRTACVGVLVVVMSIVCSASRQGAGTASSTEPFLGTWSGSWAASGSGGGFALTLAKASDVTVSGSVSVTGEPTYKATFKSVSFDGTR